jgi:hypothetical protein
MSKKLILSISLVALVSAAVLYYIIYSKKYSARALAHESICTMYNYDKANPSTHGNYGDVYHKQSWQKFETQFGPSGASSLDEFCSK